MRWRRPALLVALAARLRVPKRWHRAALLLALAALAIAGAVFAFGRRDLAAA